MTFLSLLAPSSPTHSLSAAASARASVSASQQTPSQRLLTASIEVNSSGRFLVSGALNFNTAPQLNARGGQLIAASPMPIFDFAGVTNSDNAGLALLITWIRHAKHLHKAVKFCHIPPQLLAIAKVSGLYNAIPIIEDKEKKQLQSFEEI